REEQRSAGLVVPEEARAYDASRVLREIGPTIVVYIGTRLTVGTADERHPPSIRNRRRVPAGRISRAARRSVQKNLLITLRRWEPRHQVHYTAHRPGTV